MNANQAKASVETAKEVMNDKTLKTKGDKDRRLREKKQQNTKKFMDERKTMEIKQGREKEKLKVTHEKQVADLDKDIDGVSLCIEIQFRCNKYAKFFNKKKYIEFFAIGLQRQISAFNFFS